jgi:synaptobrevin family protein YKT6
VKESLVFGARTVCNRCQLKESAAIELQDVEARCYIIIRPSGLAAVILADKDYPERVCFSVLQQMHKDFEAAFDVPKELARTADADLKFPKLEEMIKKYQDPKEADKLEKLKDILKDVEDICHKNLKDLMKRG